MLYRHQPRRQHSSAHRNCNQILTVVACGIVTAGLAHGQSVSAKSPATAGSIQGLVTDPTGKPVAGTAIWAIRTFSLAPVSAPISVSVNTDAKGFYLLPTMAPASYRICVGSEGAMLLDPCAWSANPPIWNLESGQAAKVNIELVQGVFVHVRIDDPSGAIEKAEQSSNGSALVVSGLSASGQRVHFIEVVNDATGRNFRALVPTGDSVQVQLGTPLSVTDALGNSVSSVTTPGVATPVAVTSTASGEQTLRLTVQ
jgi:Carboxypeptidase regulatory-like domain